jgi:hypothetical protein
MASPKVACPLCNQFFVRSVIEVHASECSGEAPLTCQRLDTFPLFLDLIAHPLHYNRSSTHEGGNQARKRPRPDDGNPNSQLAPSQPFVPQLFVCPDNDDLSSPHSDQKEPSVVTKSERMAMAARLLGGSGSQSLSQMITVAAGVTAPSLLGVTKLGLATTDRMSSMTSISTTITMSRSSSTTSIGQLNNNIHKTNHDARQLLREANDARRVRHRSSSSSSSSSPSPSPSPPATLPTSSSSSTKSVAPKRAGPSTSSPLSNSGPPFVDHLRLLTYNIWFEERYEIVDIHPFDFPV